jgi:hypothetical protein
LSLIAIGSTSGQGRLISSQPILLDAGSAIEPFAEKEDGIFSTLEKGLFEIRKELNGSFLVEFDCTFANYRPNRGETTGDVRQDFLDKDLVLFGKTLHILGGGILERSLVHASHHFPSNRTNSSFIP